MLPTRFTNTTLIGTGGFAKVYATIDSELGEIAVKAPTDFTSDELQRFGREVELQSELSHPNIVEVLDFDLSVTPPWYAMERAMGNLAQVTREDSWDDATLLGLFRDVLSGVGHAHGKHVLHRDLKPGNVLVYEDQGSPVAKVSDFGLGRRFTRDRMKFQTETAFAAGTDFYTAPEQWNEFREVDETADVFSLGRILDQMVSARPTILATNPQVADCIRVATRSDPLERYQSVEQLAVAVGLATAARESQFSAKENLVFAIRSFLRAPKDSFAVHGLMDGLEKLSGDAGRLGAALGGIPETGVRALCAKHPGRLRSLLYGLLSVERRPEPVDAAVRDRNFLEVCLDATDDESLRAIALFSLVRLAAIYEMSEFSEPALHWLYTTGDALSSTIFRSLLATDELAVEWLKANVDRAKFTMDLEGD